MRRQFTKEFKQGILQELETKPLSEVCREHMLHPSTVSGWRSDYERNPRDAFKGHGRPWKPEAKIARLERMLGELYAENTLLKKVMERTRERAAEERRARGGAQ